MTPQILAQSIIPAAMALLPDQMDTSNARIMLTAIALQESGLRHRRQIRGPARGLWQFEEAGLIGVLRHPSSAGYAAELVDDLIYSNLGISDLHAVLEHNDVLACGIARLLLWTLPDEMAGSAADGWAQYLAAWRPGKPHEDRWIPNYSAALSA